MATARLYPPVDGGEWTETVSNPDGGLCMIVVTPSPVPGGKPTLRCVATGCPHDCTLNGPVYTYDPAHGGIAWEDWSCDCVGA